MEFGIAFKGDLDHKRMLAISRQVEAGDYLHNVAEYQRFSIRNYHAWLATIDESVRF